MPPANARPYDSAEANLRALQRRQHSNDTKISSREVDALFVTAQKNHDVDGLLAAGAKLLGPQSASLFEKSAQVEFVQLAFKHAQAHHGLGEFFELGASLQRRSPSAGETAAQAAFMKKAAEVFVPLAMTRLAALKGNSSDPQIVMGEPAVVDKRTGKELTPSFEALSDALYAQSGGPAGGGELYLKPGGEKFTLEGRDYVEAQVFVFEGNLYVMAKPDLGFEEEGGSQPVFYPLGAVA